jgi:HD-GYP domain-containing protein (c-di-GMP phosphodiesterase class II)/HAMP domain-containing protein
MKRRYPLHIHIATLFLLLLLLVGGLIAGISYKFSRDMLETSAEDLTVRISRETFGDFRQLIAPAEMAVNMLRHGALASATSLSARMAHIGLIRDVLDNAPALSSIYVGYGNGDFFFVRRLLSAAERAAPGVPPGTVYLVQSIERGDGPRGRGAYLYLDRSLRVLRRDDRPEYVAAYDPRTRGWYGDALQTPSLVRTAPYLFFSNRKVGMTLAARAGTGPGVIGADILLETLGERLQRQKVTPGTQLALVDADGYLIAHEDVRQLVTVPEGADAQPRLTRIADLRLPVLPQLAGRIASLSSPEGRRLRMHADNADWQVEIHPMQFQGARPLYLVSAIPEQELFAAANKMRSSALLITVVIIVLAMPLTWFTARVIARPLRELADEAEAIRRFEFSRHVQVRSMIKEVDELGVTMDGMKRAIRRFLDISAAVAAEKDFDRLLPMLLGETLAAADADAGVLYLVDDGSLIPAAARMADGADLQQALPSLALSDPGPLLDNALRDGAAHAGALQHDDLARNGLGGLTTELGAQQAVAVPLLNRQQQLVGVMLLLRRTAIEDTQLSFVRALSGSAASSLETRELIKVQKELFEAFIQMIAGAIDAKSPYTGGHCARVPELTKMLARAACAATAGPWRDFRLDEEEWEAVHVASWLHDCGKVTTPEFVVDKATKLETIYDRIHEVRMRFEVLKRDAEIDCLKAIAAGADEAAARGRLTAEHAVLDADFAFVAECNAGGEFMAAEKIARLRAIAQRTWQRTLDDRIGIAHIEKARRMRTPAPALPATEALLADKPEHLIERRPEERLPADNKWGFRVTVPELLYNRGELYNLAVARGTLSEEERYKINEHIIQTEIMLRQLPFPKYLSNVPEIACGHHEKMDGTGYPKRLTREQMSPVARMMAIADIFEALTAADRPYKKGKTLSEAIKIMSFMKKDRHIDPELFDLFLRAGVYRDYAARYMAPEQIDDVDVAPYLSAA